MEDFLWRLGTFVVYCAIMLGLWLGLGWVLDQMSLTGQVSALIVFGLFMLFLAIREVLLHRRRRSAASTCDRKPR
jgi:hypothetical protein